MKTLFFRIILLCSFLNASVALAQVRFELTDLSAFRPAAPNWKIVGEAEADLNQKNTVTSKPGTGILLNDPADAKYGPQYNLITKLEHGDADLEFDFMMAKGSNSGVYFQGRYEMQLLDSWGIMNPNVHDCAAIYERWDDSRPGYKGFEGVPPRTNVCKAPGLWQHLKVEFQAPKFDASGAKTANAKFIKVVFNGVVIHENVEVTGPTRGPMLENESATGPLLIQGDHGPVAFRNIVLQNYDKPAPKVSSLTYALYKGVFTEEPNFDAIKPTEEGKATNGISYTYAKTDNDYLVRFKGTLSINEAGKYRFAVTSRAGNASLKIGGKTVLPWKWWENTATADLSVGDLPFEIAFAKNANWTYASLGLTMSGPGVRPTNLHALDSYVLSDPTNPILVSPAAETVIHRSFVEVGNKKLPHGVSVGDPTGLHYSVDLENGALVRVWRGGFLDATAMFNDRGNGFSSPLGSALDLLTDNPMAVLTDESLAWPTASPEAQSYRFRGYDTDAKNQPTFKYETLGASIEDKITPDTDNKRLNRAISATNAPSGLWYRLAQGAQIETLPAAVGATAQMYCIDKTYYLEVKGQTAKVRDGKNGQELIAPLANAPLNYAIIW